MDNDTMSPNLKRCTVCLNEYPDTSEYFYEYQFFDSGMDDQCIGCRDVSMVTPTFHVNILNKLPKIVELKAHIKRKKTENELREGRRTYRQQAKQDSRYKEQQRAYRKKRRQQPDYKEKQREYRKVWRKRPESRAIKKAEYQNRRARKRSLPYAFTRYDWQRAMEYFNHRCAICDRPRGLWHMIAPDHWIALADPRPDNPGTVAWNIVPLCHGVDGCNNSKNGKVAEEWLIEQFGKRKAKKILERISAYFEWVRGLAR